MNNQNSDISNYYNQDNIFISPHVGGLNKNISQEYINTQEHILDKQNQNYIGVVPDNINRVSHNDLITGVKYGFTDPNIPNKTTEYDPYIDFLQKKGLMKENYRARINTTYVNINSASRKLNPTVNTDNTIYLSNSSFYFSNESVNIGFSKRIQYLMKIKVKHNDYYKLGDKIVVSGIEPITESMTNQYILNGITHNAIIFTPNKNYITFICNYDNGTNISPMSFNPAFSVGNGISYDILKKYDTSDMYVSLNGFVGDNNTDYIGNIPINFLNSNHRVWFSNPNGEPDTIINVPVNGVVKKITGFYIKLEENYEGTQPTNNMIIDLVFGYIGGIPLNRLLSGYPISNNNISGSHIITNITSNTITINISKQPYYYEPSISDINGKSILFGGENAIISRLISVDPGFSSPSIYEINIPKEIKNVIMVKLVNSIFPVDYRVFSSNPIIRNNKLYWQNKDDGEFIYSISIDSGTYSDKAELETEIENKISLIKRKTEENSNYTNKSIIKVKINTNTNITTFESFKEARIIKPITNITPPINDSNINNYPYTLTIHHKLHRLSKGDKVIFKDFIQTNGIPSKILNKEHIIDNIIDNDNYTIILEPFNIDSDLTYTGGGYESKIYVPNYFRLLFNYPDTMGEELGFRNVGESDSITKYNNIITNKDTYPSDYVITDSDGYQYVIDTSGNNNIIDNTSLKLSGCDYILMKIKQLNHIYNTHKDTRMNECFSIINLDSSNNNLSTTNNMLYNTFVQTPITLFEPIDLVNLNISFYTPNGQLYNFIGRDHSFTLEITSIDYIPQQTEIISTKTNL